MVVADGTFIASLRFVVLWKALRAVLAVPIFVAGTVATEFLIT